MLFFTSWATLFKQKEKDWQVFLFAQRGQPHDEILNEAERSRLQQINRFQNTINIMRERADRLRERCKLLKKTLQDPKNKLQYRYDRGQFIVNDQHKLLMCTIAKIACGNWKEVFAQLHLGKAKQNTSYEIHTFARKTFSLRQYTKEQEKDIIHNYTKIAFVRHPFERLTSTYRDKMLNEKGNRHTYFKTHGRKVLVKYKQYGRPNATYPNFEQYIRSLTDSKFNEFDDHWARYIDVCDPCRFNYTYIGEHNHVAEEAPALFYQLGISDLVNFPERSKTAYRKAKSSEVARRYLNELPEQVYNQIYDKYSMDFILFGYNQNDISNSTSTEL